MTGLKDHWPEFVPCVTEWCVCVCVCLCVVMHVPYMNLHAYTVLISIYLVFTMYMSIVFTN